MESDCCAENLLRQFLLQLVCDKTHRPQPLLQKLVHCQLCVRLRSLCRLQHLNGYCCVGLSTFATVNFAVCALADQIQQNVWLCRGRASHSVCNLPESRLSHTSVLHGLCHVRQASKGVYTICSSCRACMLMEMPGS